jgi:hypothetical protein
MLGDPYIAALISIVIGQIIARNGRIYGVSGANREALVDERRAKDAIGTYTHSHIVKTNFGRLQFDFLNQRDAPMTGADFVLTSCGRLSRLSSRAPWER